jgi:cell shape-determining protein MreD
VVIGTLLLVHFALHPVWTAWRAGPDLLAGGLLLGSLGLRASRAAALGFVLGLLEASMALGPLGPTMLILAAAGWGGARLRDVFYSDSARFMPTFLVVGVWVIEVLQGFVGGGGMSPAGVLVYAPLSALATAAVCWGTERLVSFFVA